MYRYATSVRPSLWEAEWWNKRGLGAEEKEAGDDALASAEDKDKGKEGKDKKKGWGFGAGGGRQKKKVINKDGVDMRIPDAELQDSARSTDFTPKPIGRGR